MDKLKIEIIKLGDSKHAGVWTFIKKLYKNNNSKIYEIVSIKEVALPNTKRYDWSYSDSELTKLMGASSTSDIRLAFIDYPLEGNYYVRRLDKSTAIVTFYQAANILKSENISLNNYVLLKIYISCTAYQRVKDDNTIIVENLFHHETRGCLFDMTGIKTDILASVDKPKICVVCESEMKKTLIDNEYLPTLRKELRQIKKSLFYKIFDFIKKHPVLSILVTIISSLIVNLASNYVYDILTKSN